MAGINDYTRNLERIDGWLRRQTEPSAAIFDIGTRAARLMVAPKRLPPARQWNEELFFTAGFVTGLGRDVGALSTKLDPSDSPGLEKLADFLKASMQVLDDNGVPPENIVAIGTEVFRSLKPANLADVFAWLKRRTGVTVQMITEDQEARLSLYAAMMTYKNGLSPGQYAADDALLLIDQGGGSTEVSYAVAGKFGQVASLAELGTVDLRREFFETTENGRVVDAASLHASIPEQYDRVVKYVGDIVDGWEHLNRGQALRYAYGLGTAITECYPGANTWKVHNRVVTVSQMAHIERERRDRMSAVYPSVARLHHSIATEDDEHRQVKRDKEVLMIYGLPVYRLIVERLRLPEIRVCGFPLRYGAFVTWHHSGRDFDMKVRAAGS